MGSIVGGGDGAPVVIGGMRVRYLARSDATGDGMGIYRVEMDPRAPGAGLHRHAVLTEAFDVHEGRLTLRIGEADHELRPGDFALIPPGVAHAFANRSDRPVRYTLSFTPALGREGFFEGLAALAAEGRLSDAAAMTALMRRHDQEPLAGFAEWSALG